MKNIKNFINEKLSSWEKKVQELTKNLDGDACDVFDRLEDVLSWNDDTENQILLDLDETKSIYKAIDKNKYWKFIAEEINWNRILKKDEMKSIPSLVEKITKENDKVFSEAFLLIFSESIKELKEMQEEK